MLIDLAAGAGPHELGGKGASLLELVRAGLPVPPAWCIPASVLAELLACRGLGEPAEQVEASLADGTWQAPARRLRAAILGAELPASLAREIGELFGRLQPDSQLASLAVRSSATCEGVVGASFAGQFQTFLDVQDANQAGAAIRSCWASLWSPAALSYRAAQPLGSPPDMAVLLQEFRPARVAGSARVDEHGVEIEAAFGLGAAVMSGLVLPDRYSFAVDGRPERAEPGRKPVRAAAEGGNLVWERLPEEQQTALSLEAEASAEVCRLARRAADRLGQPLEIEWLQAEDGRFWLLQGRRAERRSRSGDESVASARTGQLRGIPAAAGRVVGPVHLIHDPEHLSGVGPNEIVVTRYASPALAARLAGAGLATEMGGVSSHAAVIARERQIPMVTGVLRITQLLRPGQVVELDGSAGLITPLPASGTA